MNPNAAVFKPTAAGIKQFNRQAAANRTAPMSYASVGLAKPRKRRLPRFPRNGAPARNRQIPNTFMSRQSGAPRFRVNGRFRRNADSQIVIKTEKWFDVLKGTNKYVFQPGTSGIPHLDRFAQIHENYQLRYMQIQYRPSAGTNIPGNFTMGVDYSPENDRKKQDITLLEPNRSGTIFTSSSMTVVINRAMKNLSWLYTSTAETPDPKSKSFALYTDVNSDADMIGEIWVAYKIAFSTATSAKVGSTVAQPIAITSVDHVSDAAYLPPSITNIGQNEKTLIQIVDTPSPISITEDVGTQYETVLKLDMTDMPVGSEFTVGTLEQTPSSLASFRSNLREGPKIHFTYADGSPVPDGSIVPVPAQPKILLDSGVASAELFATLFAIAKPLIKPLLGSVIELIAPLLENNILDVPDIIQTPSETYSVFAFGGNEATIALPQVDDEPYASKLPLSFMYAFGVGVDGSPTANQVKPYSFFQPTFINPWFTSAEVSKDPPYRMDISLQKPGSNLSFQPGDLIAIHVSAITMDKGFSGSVYPLPTPAKYSEQMMNTVASWISEHSTLGNSKKPMLILESTYDNTMGTSKSNGISIIARFDVDPDLEEDPTKIVISVPLEPLATGIPQSENDYEVGSNVPPKPVVYKHPNEGFINALMSINVAFYPSSYRLSPLPPPTSMFIKMEKLNTEDGSHAGD